MKKSNNTKKKFLMSVLALVLSVSMLIGTTLAWFTDSVTSGKNRIVAGNLDVEVTHSNGSVTDETVKDATNLFSISKWEPGAICYENITVKNVGDLAFKYNLSLNIADYNTVFVDGIEYSLNDVLKVYVSDTPFTGNRTDAQGLDYAGTLGSFSRNGILFAGESSADTYAIVIYWEPSDADNIYNINNGKQVETSIKGVTKEQASNELFVEFGINVNATQYTYEEDSFDELYDDMPVIWTEVSAFGSVGKTNLNGDIIVEDESEVLVNAKIPGVPFDKPLTEENKENFQYKVQGTETFKTPDTDRHDDILTLNVSPKGITTTSATYDVTLSNTTHNEKIAEINKVMEIQLLVGTGLSSVAVSHSGVPMTEAATKADQTYNYDSTTGIVTIYTKSFSPFEITWSENPFSSYLKIESPAQAIDILPYTYNNPSMTVGLTEEYITGVAAYVGVDSFNSVLHGAQYKVVGQLDAGNPRPETDPDQLLMSNCRTYKAIDPTSYLQEDGKYQNWHGDFVISFNKDIDAYKMNATSLAENDNSIILAGNYGEYGWLKFPIDTAMERGTQKRLLNEYMDGIYTINYKELCTLVQEFTCGAVYLKSDYNTNDPLKMTIEFRMYETYSEEEAQAHGYGKTKNVETGKSILVDTYTYTFR